MKSQAVIEAFNDAFNRQDIDAVMAMMTDDCVFEGTNPPDGNVNKGQEEVRAAFEAVFASAPPNAFATEELIATDDRVTVKWRYSWGDGHVRGVDVFQLEGDKIKEKCAYVKG